MHRAALVAVNAMRKSVYFDPVIQFFSYRGYFEPASRHGKPVFKAIQTFAGGVYARSVHLQTIGTGSQAVGPKRIGIAPIPQRHGPANLPTNLRTAPHGRR